MEKRHTYKEERHTYKEKRLTYKEKRPAYMEYRHVASITPYSHIIFVDSLN